jgi:hypothetical protein
VVLCSIEVQQQRIEESDWDETVLTQLGLRWRSKKVEEADDGETDDELDGDRDEGDGGGVVGEDVPELLLLRGLSEEEEGTTAAPSPRSAQRTAAIYDSKDSVVRLVFLVLRTN